jgi:hypothetical protein
MSGSEKKQIRIELTEDEYDVFREIATECGMAIEEAGHEALIEWAEHQHRVDSTDRAFTILDELGTVALSSMAATDARNESDIVEEWSGSDVSFTLADEPSEHRE